MTGGAENRGLIFKAFDERIPQKISRRISPVKFGIASNRMELSKV